MRIRPMLSVLGCAKINVHVYVTEASLHARSMGVRGSGCLSCLGGQAPEHGHVCDTSWNDLFCLYPFIFLPVCWYVHLSCLLCSQEAPNHVPTGKVMVSETSPA